MIRSIAVGVLALGAGLALAACGDDDDDTNQLQPTAGSSGAAGAGGGAAGAGAGGAGGGDAGAGGQGGRGEPQWACLDEPPPRPSSELVDITLQIVSGSDRKPAADATARACDRLDLACSTPIAPAAPVDAAGEVSLRVPGNFDGYFEIRSSSLGPTPSFVPVNASLPQPGLIRGTLAQRVLVYAPADLSALTVLAGGSFDAAQPPNAMLVAGALDCQGNPAAGVVFEIAPATLRSDKTKIFYVNRGVPDSSAVETDASGSFGVTNLNAGVLTLTGSLGEPRRALPEGTAILRDGEMTSVFVAP